MNLKATLQCLKLANIKIIIFLIVSTIVLFFISKISISFFVANIENAFYKQEAERNIQIVSSTLESKKESFLNLTVAISNYEEIEELLEKDDFEILKLRQLLAQLKETTSQEDFKIRIFDRFGDEKFKSWEDDKKVNFAKNREHIYEVVNNLRTIINTDIEDLKFTFKALAPLVNENGLIGILEVTSDLDSIAKYLKQNNIQPIILVDKKSIPKDEVKDNISIGDYYVINNSPSFRLVDFLKKHDIKDIVSNHDYLKMGPYFISSYKDYDYINDIVVTFLLFQNLNQVKSKSIEAFKNVSILALMVIYTSLFLIVFLYFYFKEKEKDHINELTRQYNIELEQKINEELENSRKKDTILANQSKLASLGEMLGNIAHQWRQPLSAISTATSSMQVKYEYGLLTKDEFEELTNGVIKNTEYLSNTIDDFRDFFQKDKVKEKFNLSMKIKNSYNIIKSLYVKNKIDTVFELDEKLEYIGYKNELFQVILNLLNNAKDILIEKEIEKKVVLIKLFLDDEYIIMEFHDNANGVPDDINDKIFEPYFTTKHKAQGTGIGLYMSNEIITKHFDGQIYNENSTFIVDGIEYFGANFIIKLPKSGIIN